MPGQPCCSGFFFARNIINQSSRTTCLIQRRRSIWNDTRKMVPEGGFEPPTRGFSIRCSTPELLGLHGKNRVGAQPIERRYTPWQAQNQSCEKLSTLSS